MASCQILLVDDQPLARDAMRSVIQAFSSVDIGSVRCRRFHSQGSIDCRTAKNAISAGRP